MGAYWVWAGVQRTTRLENISIHHNVQCTVRHHQKYACTCTFNVRGSIKEPTLFIGFNNWLMFMNILFPALVPVGAYQSAWAYPPRCLTFLLDNHRHWGGVTSSHHRQPAGKVGHWRGGRLTWSRCHPVIVDHHARHDSRRHVDQRGSGSGSSVFRYADALSKRDTTYHVWVIHPDTARQHRICSSISTRHAMN